MKKDFGSKPWLFPIPNYMLGSYNEDGSVDVMVVGWGGCVADEYVAINISREHKTFANIEKRGAFTLAVPTAETMKESDFLGIASANKMADKFARTGLHAEKAANVDAPVIAEYPLTMECRVEKISEEPYGPRILAKIINVSADESVLGDDGRIDAEKLHTFVFDQTRNGYHAVGVRTGKAWHEGAELMKR